MSIQKGRQHTIDFIFPLAVLFVFAVSAFTVLLLSAHVYADQTARTQSDYQAATPLSYIREKVRQNDQSGALSIGLIKRIIYPQGCGCSRQRWKKYSGNQRFSNPGIEWRTLPYLLSDF